MPLDAIKRSVLLTPTLHKMTTFFVILTVEKNFDDYYLSCTVTQRLWLGGALRWCCMSLSFSFKDLVRVKGVSREVSSTFHISYSN